MLRSLITCLMLLLGSMATTFPAFAEGSEAQSPNVLVVYSNEDNEIDEYQRMLDMLIGHFTTRIQFVSTRNFQAEQLKGITHLFYQGIKQEELPDDLRDELERFPGTVVASGHNIEQLGPAFSFAEPLAVKKFNEMYVSSDPDRKIRIALHEVQNINPDKSSSVLAWAKGGHTAYPLITKKERYFYVGLSKIDYNSSLLLAEVFHEVFDAPHKRQHPGYIRLEDVHPMVDPVKLKQVAEVLKEKEIPYMIAVIPVYVNPETGEQFHMSDYPKVLEVLKYMQKNGGSIVQHGYTHQYRSTETGEGFEFWDVENNTPIYKNATDPAPLKGPNNFKNDQEYEAYLQELLSFEQEYVTKKVTKGINELNGFGLQPLAFEAPHYTMSQNGYQTVASHYSTYVGQVQLSDKDWKTMDSTPYITRPSFLHGMTLLPETLGYVQPEDPQALETIVAKAENQLIVRDGIVSLFYHPYLGVEKFKELLEHLENLPDIEWIDLKQETATASTSEVMIAAKNGKIHTSRDTFGAMTDSKESFNYHMKTAVDKITWAMVGTGTLAVIFFTIYTIVSYRRLAKEEWRDKVG
ncbi:DUF2334 domain-containing protein [Thalassobacillus devorans]|uniref:DUF2334 domain-containing protein n=1 Tax=Thalassobacillus devorans TaxID=279813 RepID=UPI0004B05F87|nr:polysaccharide deacetylase family protein [Thalassobacillus devorans]